MASNETNLTDDENGIEEWLESELAADEGDVNVPPEVLLPSKIRWIASDGANVVVNQVLAAFSPVHKRCRVANIQLPGNNGSELDDRDAKSYAGMSSSPPLTLHKDGRSNRETHRTNHLGTDISIQLEPRPQDGESCKDSKTGVTYGTQGGPEAQGNMVTSSSFLLRSTRHGTLKHAICTDTVITDSTTVLGKIENATCSHYVVIHGLCVSCCQVVEKSPPKRPKSTSKAHSESYGSDHMTGPDHDMVVPGFITSDNAVRLDAGISNEMELLEILALLRKRKLCLVLDLDNTLIHSSCVKQPDDIDIPVIDMYSNTNGYKLQFDDMSKNKRYEEDLESSVLITRTLNEVDSRLFTNYYKLRPGVYEFLRKTAKLYDLYLFTMGTRAHARAALKILDPDGSCFGNRIFSRSEANSGVKSLSRIFPNYKNLLLILDDSEHIWENSPGLIKVYPYYYFSTLNVVGSRDTMNIGRVSAVLQAPCNYSNYIWPSTIMNIWEENEPSEDITRDDDGFTIPMNIRGPKPRRTSFKYNRMLIANERPSSIFRNPEEYKSVSNTLKSQAPEISVKLSDVPMEAPAISDEEPLKAEVMDDTSTSQHAPVTTANNVKPSEYIPADSKAQDDDSSLPSPSPKTMMRKIRKIHVKDCDAQLAHVTNLLKEMHSQFFSQFDETDFTLQDLKKLIEDRQLPDVGSLLTRHRKNILKGVVLSAKSSDFRGSHSGADFDFLTHTDLGITARQFGVVHPSVKNAATHYLNNNVSAVAPKPGVKKVHIQWLEACIYTWTHVNELGFDPDGWHEPSRTFWDALDKSKS